MLIPLKTRPKLVISCLGLVLLELIWIWSKDTRLLSRRSLVKQSQRIMIRMCLLNTLLGRFFSPRFRGILWSNYSKWTGLTLEEGHWGSTHSWYTAWDPQAACSSHQGLQPEICSQVLLTPEPPSNPGSQPCKETFTGTTGARGNHLLVHALVYHPVWDSREMLRSPSSPELMRLSSR